MLLITLKDVAERAGVSVTTVSRMLNNKGNVSIKTQNIINAAMQELGYFPNDMARSLTVKTSNFIGLIVPSVKSFFFSSVVEHVEISAAEKGFKLLLCVTGNDSKKERDCYKMLMCNRVAGIIQCNLSPKVEKHVHPDSPVVVFERTPSLPIPSVLADNYGGGRMAAEHLIAKGCNRPIYISAKMSSEADGNKREDGFLNAFQEHGLPAPITVNVSWKDRFSSQLDKTIREIFSIYPNIDAIASNDVVAAAVVKYCLKNGIRIPEDIKIIGYDNTPFASLCAIPLTTIHQPIEEMCSYAIDVIIKRAAGHVVPLQTVLPVHLVERQTT
jgi:LacI family sucrose operon transcriptional repressor